jgi:hypothetical protein
MLVTCKCILVTWIHVSIHLDGWVINTILQVDKHAVIGRRGILVTGIVSPVEDVFVV